MRTWWWWRVCYIKTSWPLRHWGLNAGREKSMLAKELWFEYRIWFPYNSQGSRTSACMANATSTPEVKPLKKSAPCRDLCFTVQRLKIASTKWAGTTFHQHSEDLCNKFLKKTEFIFGYLKIKSTSLNHLVPHPFKNCWAAFHSSTIPASWWVVDSQADLVPWRVAPIMDLETNPTVEHSVSGCFCEVKMHTTQSLN